MQKCIQKVKKDKKTSFQQFTEVIFFATMFWVGLGLFVRARIANPLSAAGIILAVGLFPSVFALLGTVWKDLAA